MAVFTVELRDIVNSQPEIGLVSYPIFDEAYRPQLNKKIIEHYLLREIGVETVEMFVFMLQRKMNEIMPIYNQLYKSELLAIDPLLTFRQTTVTKSSAANVDKSVENSSASNEGRTGSKSRTVSSEMPQTMLSDEGDYATSAADAVSETDATGGSTSSGTSEREGSQTGESEATASGFAGSMSAMLMEYRQTFLNIDMMIIGELDTLFMGVWDNGDERYPYSRPNFMGWWF